MLDLYNTLSKFEWAGRANYWVDLGPTGPHKYFSTCRALHGHNQLCEINADGKVVIVLY